MAAHSSLNLHEIAVFIAAARSASFSQAARRLHLSQPAVSQAIHSLERQFGTPLFERHARAGRLTPAGEALLPVACELDAAAARARSLEEVNREVAKRLDAAIGTIRSLLAADER